MTAAGQVTAVCLVHTDRQGERSDGGSSTGVVGPFGRTAIDKRPVSGPVAVGALGLHGDHVANTKVHGGVDQAVYAYAEEEAQRWADELGRELPPGWFGENLRMAGMPVTDAIVGERWQVGDGGLVLETTRPRVPCAVFARRAGEPRWVKRFAARGDTGAYLRVVQPGVVCAGDRVVVVSRPEHGVTVRDLFERKMSSTRSSQ